MTQRARIRWAVASGVLLVVLVLSLAFEQEYCAVCARTRQLVCLWPFGPVGPRIIVSERVHDSSLTRLFVSRGIQPGGEHAHEWASSSRVQQWGRVLVQGRPIIEQVIDDDPELATAVMQRLLYPYDSSAEYEEQFSALWAMSVQYAVDKDLVKWRTATGLPPGQDPPP